MKNSKGKITTAVIIFVTLILAGVAIFTAIRLYQLRQQPVAPNVPSSIPRAQEVTPSPSPQAGTCSLSFALAAAPGAVTCTSKTVYKDVAANTAGTYDMTAANLFADGATVTAGQKIVYVITTGPADTTKSIAITDTLPTGITYEDGVSICTYADATRKVTCTLTTTNTKAAFRVTVNSDATGVITNTASVQGMGDAASTCAVSVKLPGATITTPSPTPTPTPGAPNSCNGTCGSNFNCQSNLVCFQGFCRNPSCTASSNCLCGSATPAPSLPQSGTDWPTTLGAGFGILVIIGSLLLAF